MRLILLQVLRKVFRMEVCDLASFLSPIIPIPSFSISHVEKIGEPGDEASVTHDIDKACFHFLYYRTNTHGKCISVGVPTGKSWNSLYTSVHSFIHMLTDKHLIQMLHSVTFSINTEEPDLMPRRWVHSVITVFVVMMVIDCKECAAIGLSQT